MFGDRLRLARARVGLSLRDLSAAIDGEVSPQAIGKYEAGEMMPSAKILVLLAKKLDVSLDFLMSAQVVELSGVEFRDTRGTGAKERDRIQAAVIDAVERYLAVEQILDMENHRPDLGSIVNQFVSNLLGADELANRLRIYWELGNDPILSITDLLEDKGFKVIEARLPEKVDGLTCLVKLASEQEPVPVIVINENATIERRRFTLCHELAHRVISAVEDGLNKEKIMHRFAGAFLMPQNHLQREVGGPRRAFARLELIRLKHIYGVSAAALLMRLASLGLLTDSGLSFAFQTYARSWRSIEPDPIKPSPGLWSYEKPGRFARFVYRALAEHLISAVRAAQLLGQSLSEIEFAMKGPSLAYADNNQ